MVKNLPQPAIEVSNLTKFYGNFKALDSISFNVDAGWIYGYLGPNGAGKTTTIRIMLGLLKPHEGKVKINGFDPLLDPVHALKSVGYAPELPILPSFFSAEEMLDLTGKMYGLPSQERKKRIDELLNLVGLSEVKKNKIGKYSKGMVQRLSVALALINDPQILIMDEPTIGMDPEATAHFRNLFLNLGKQGKTVFISSHLLDEVQRICTHVGMINKGKILFNGEISQVLEKFTQQWIVEAELETVTPNIVSNLKKLDYVKDVKVEGNKLQIELKERKDLRGEISSEIFKHKGVLLSLNLHKTTLEEAYLRALRGE
ncbi:MAG: ABC transporter ATP-binding protein [Candidatus Bathyarchaeia archaeon]